MSWTLRCRYIGIENLKAAKLSNQGESHLAGIWHQSILSYLISIGIKNKENKYFILISKSKDADPMDFIAKKKGWIAIRGSSRSKENPKVDKGGNDAILKAIELLQIGISGHITVDGPTGPAKKVKSGIIKIASKSSIQIIPIASIPERYWCLNATWDKTLIPKPFSKIITAFGPPLSIPKDLSKEKLEDYKIDFEIALNQTEIIAQESFSSWQALSNKI